MQEACVFHSVIFNTKTCHFLRQSSGISVLALRYTTRKAKQPNDEQPNDEQPNSCGFTALLRHANKNRRRASEYPGSTTYWTGASSIAKRNHNGNRLNAMVVYSLVIINKAGGLVYQRDFQAGLQKLSTNDYLVLAGTFHGVHAITRSLTPIIPYSAPATSNTSASTIPLTSTLPNPGLPKTGLEVLETERFRLTCFQTVTGTKFLLFTDPLMPNVDNVIARIYELYADYVMKNPFYQLEMPVRCESFDRHLGTWLRGR